MLQASTPRRILNLAHSLNYQPAHAFLIYMARTAKPANRWAPIVAVIILGLALIVVRMCRPVKNTGTEKQTTETTTTQRGLNRNPANIIYSKHARCRMACRHIDESEVKEILHDGKINYGKSEVGNNPDCKKKYALEGKTHDNQRVRIIFAPCQSEVTVVTVIDLDTDWECNCE